MATLTTILDVETEVETVLAAYLAASPYSLAAITSDTDGSLTTPRVEVIAEVIRWGPQQYIISSGTYAGRAVFVDFALRLTLNLTYQPAASQGQASIRGKLRAALSDRAAIKTAFAVHNYIVPVGESFRVVGGARTVSTGEKTETLTTECALTMVVNPNALAAAS